MLKERWVRELREVLVCKRCDSSKEPILAYQFGQNKEGVDSDWADDLCPKCVEMMFRKLQGVARRGPRKAKPKQG